MRLLSESYEPEELNRKGFSLYCDLRPDIEPGRSGWGKRGKVPCEVILKLRKEARADGTSEDVGPTPTIQHIAGVEDDSQGGEPRPKKPRINDTSEMDEDELFGD